MLEGPPDVREHRAREGKRVGVVRGSPVESCAKIARADERPSRDGLGIGDNFCSSRMDFPPDGNISRM